ncbi:MAG: hypothetical protein J6S54_06745 [Lentisphaeria bacterium]|nr:hypothetical protein [Lentisphaeria bacterium]
MKLKHPWMPEEAKIILALKKELTHDSLRYVQISMLYDCMHFFQELETQCGNEADISLLWEKCRYYGVPMEYRNWGEMPFRSPLCFHLFCQGAAMVLGGINLLDRRKIPEIMAFYDLFFASAKVTEPPHLPERLQDQAIRRAIDADDTPRVICLYNTSMNQGNKLKNMFHIMLNRKHYDMAMKVHAVCGGLEQIPAEVLWCHCALMKKECSKDFTDYVRTVPQSRDFSVWHYFSNSEALTDIMFNGLQRGLSPDLPLMKYEEISVSLRRWAYFTDEMSEEISEWSEKLPREQGGWRGNCDKGIRRLNERLETAKRFVLWEKENS